MLQQEIKVPREKPVPPEQKPEIGEVRVEKVPRSSQEIQKPSSVAQPVRTEPAIKKEVRKIKALDQQNQVKVLCDLAFQKGLSRAIRTARSLNNAYVLDEFHDTLIDKLREQLIQKGRLKE